jgi:hypothetical protein
MKHPNADCQRKQEEFLKSCPEEEREFHARLFRYGNAAYTYHQQACSTSEKRQREYYEEWLQGLTPDIATDMKTKGFEQCKKMLPFTRYMNERNDYGMRDWMKEHLSEEDYNYYIELNGGCHDDR